MKLHILSDLHLEFGPFDFPATDADLVILAGDTHIKRNGVKWAMEAIPDTQVLYLCGNHEFYGEKFPRLVEKLKIETEGSNVQVLENDTFERDGFRFFGATLWTDMDLHGDVTEASNVIGERMNDYKRTRWSPTYRKLRPGDTRAQHRTTVSKLREFLKTGDPSKSIVLTHHAPSPLSLPERRREFLISAAYASNLEDLIVEFQPALWIHGHIHHSNDYRIGNTQILSNPRAYIDDPNPDFDPKLTIEIR